MSDPGTYAPNGAAAAEAGQGIGGIAMLVERSVGDIMRSAHQAASPDTKLDDLVGPSS